MNSIEVTAVVEKVKVKMRQQMGLNMQIFTMIQGACSHRSHTVRGQML